MFLSVVTAENGQTIDDLSAQWLATSSRPQSTGEPQLLHISENPATSDLDAFYRQPSTPGSGTVIQSDAIGRKLADVPNEWVDLSALDFIALSADELELMARTAPRTWQAVRDWTAAGGNLCIYDVGGNFEQPGAIDAAPWATGRRWPGGKALGRSNLGSTAIRRAPRIGRRRFSGRRRRR